MIDLIARNDRPLLLPFIRSAHFYCLIFLGADYLHLTLNCDMEPVKARFNGILFFSIFHLGYLFSSFCYRILLLFQRKGLSFLFVAAGYSSEYFRIKWLLWIKLQVMCYIPYHYVFIQNLRPPVALVPSSCPNSFTCSCKLEICIRKRLYIKLLKRKRVCVI